MKTTKKGLNKNIEDFLFHCKYEKNLDFKTIKAYQIDLDQFIFFVEKNFAEVTSISEIKKELIKEYIKHLSCFKPKTCKRKVASLKAWVNFFEYENDEYINPFRKIKIKIKESQILPVVMSLNEIKKIFNSVYSDYNNTYKTIYQRKTQIRNIAIIELLFATGIRVSELCSLKCDDIDLKVGSIRVFGKGRKERIIHLCQKDVLFALRNYKKEFNPETFFFKNRLGNQLSSQSVRLLIKDFAKQSKIDKKITPHTFRHTFATLLLEEDVDIKYIQNILGHSSISTTQIYTHVNIKKQKQILTTKHPRKKLSFIE